MPQFNENDCMYAIIVDKNFPNSILILEFHLLNSNCTICIFNLSQISLIDELARNPISENHGHLICTNSLCRRNEIIFSEHLILGAVHLLSILINVVTNQIRGGLRNAP